jgi:hypothetical protein
MLRKVQRTKTIQKTHSLSPVIRGEGGREGLRAFDESTAVALRKLLDPSPQPSPRSTGKKE